MIRAAIARVHDDLCTGVQIAAVDVQAFAVHLALYLRPIDGPALIRSAIAAPGDHLGAIVGIIFGQFPTS